MSEIKLYKNLYHVRFAFYLFVTLAFATLALYAMTDPFGDTMREALMTMLLSAALGLIVIIFELLNIVMNRYGEDVVCFTKSYVLFREQKYYLNEISFKYFTMELDLLTPENCVFPMLLITIPDKENIECFIPYRHFLKLQKHFSYDVKIV